MGLFNKDTRFKEIEKFLFYIKDTMKNSPGFMPDKDYIYNLLASYDFCDDECRRGYDYSNLFEKWKNDFKDNPNINVYFSDRQPGFLQFRKDDLIHDLQSIKLYLSIKPEAIDYAISRVFGYMASNGMVNYSKVSQYARADGIVLRLANSQDALNVINFINSDETLIKYSKRTNPFMMRFGIVGAGYDNMLSYNSFIANAVSLYFANKSQSLKQVNLNDFINYIDSLKYYVFDTQMLRSDFENSQYFKKNKSRLSSYIQNYPSYDLFENMKEEMDLLANSIKSNDLNLFIQGYVESKNNSLNKKNKNIDNYDLFINACLATYNKYGPQQTSVAINSALSGNFNYFTNDAGYRNSISSLKPNEMSEYLYRLIDQYGINPDISLGDNFVNIISQSIDKNKSY